MGLQNKLREMRAGTRLIVKRLFTPVQERKSPALPVPVIDRPYDVGDTVFDNADAVNGEIIALHVDIAVDRLHLRVVQIDAYLGKLIGKVSYGEVRGLLSR